MINYIQPYQQLLQDATYQETYHQNRVRSYYEELSKIKGKYSDKHEKHSKILSRFLWVGACSNGLGVACGVGGVGSVASGIGIPIGISLGVVSVSATIVNGITCLVIKRYKNKIIKNNKIHDIITSAIAALEIAISKTLNDGTLIDQPEFNQVQGIYFEAMQKISAVDHKTELDNQKNFQKAVLEEIQNLKKQ